MKITKSELREIIREEIQKLKQPKMSARLQELINKGWVLSEDGHGNRRVKNPVTGREIKVKTALSYNPSHPAYKAAIKYKSNNNLSNQSHRPPTKKEINVVQTALDNNQFLKGKTAKAEDIVVGKNNTLYRSSDAAKHIAERHRNTNVPGSTFTISDEKLDNLISQAMNTPPTIQSNGTYKFEIETPEPIGGMGVVYNPSAVDTASDYNMQNPRNPDESVKVIKGKRPPTNKMTVIAAPMGKDANGKPLLSLITTFPGGSTVPDGKGGEIEIPMDRSKFAENGFVMVTDTGKGKLKNETN